MRAVYTAHPAQTSPLPDRLGGSVAGEEPVQDICGAVSPAWALEGGNNPPARAPCRASATRGPLGVFDGANEQPLPGALRQSGIGCVWCRVRPCPKKARPPRIDRGTGDQRAGGQATCQPTLEHRVVQGRPGMQMCRRAGSRKEGVRDFEYSGISFLGTPILHFLGRVKVPKSDRSVFLTASGGAPVPCASVQPLVASQVHAGLATPHPTSLQTSARVMPRFGERPRLLCSRAVPYLKGSVREQDGPRLELGKGAS